MIRSWIEQKNYLRKLINQLSMAYGGDDEKWLQNYFEEVVLNHKNNLQVPTYAAQNMKSYLSIYKINQLEKI